MGCVAGKNRAVAAGKIQSQISKRALATFRQVGNSRCGQYFVYTLFEMYVLYVLPTLL